MPTLANLITESGTLRPQDAAIIHRLVRDWQVISDISGGDLLLALPNTKGQFITVAHTRPATAAQVFGDDMVGTVLGSVLREQLRLVMEELDMVDLLHDGLRAHLCPVMSGNRAVACLLLFQRTDNLSETSSGQKSYAKVTNLLLQMISKSRFPQDGAVTTVAYGTPHVNDGYIELDAEGKIVYLTSNAVSSLHRLGLYQVLRGKNLAELITNIVPEKVDETLAVVVTGRSPWVTEISVNEVSVSMRAIPLYQDDKRVGAVILSRDITEIRRHKADILTKNATIREIHHRVKNNLQTVAALLRLQSRRSDLPEVKQSLAEAQRRVATIALVHELLSQTIDETLPFDDVFVRLLQMGADVSSPDHKIATELVGTFGKIPAAVASPLAVVINELITNAVEHGLNGRSGKVRVEVLREGVSLSVRVIDDGTGIDLEHIHKGLGTQIVSTMVTSELKGDIKWENAPAGGTVVTITGRLDAAK